MNCEIILSGAPSAVVLREAFFKGDPTPSTPPAHKGGLARPELGRFRLSSKLWRNPNRGIFANGARKV
jgi:hypothetical protein